MSLPGEGAGFGSGAMSKSQRFRFGKGRNQNRAPKRRKMMKGVEGWPEGKSEEILEADIRNMLARVEKNGIAEEGGVGEVEGVEEARESESVQKVLPEKGSMVQLRIEELSGTGDGLAYSDAKDHIYVVPFTTPGDIVEAKPYKHFENHSLTDFLKVVTPSPKRDDSLIRCIYFAQCGGCQFQMLPYSEQLLHKKRVVEKAFENFSGLDPAVVPEVGPTWGSPLQYAYRTKLTPHFDGPRKGGFKPDTPIPEIGFMKKGTRNTMDIEDCPIGTPVLREGLKTIREHVKKNLTSYKRGATLLLRESTTRTPKEVAEGAPEPIGPNEYTEKKVCITENNAIITEYIGKYKFTSPAGTFFQNNNSILEGFTSFIRDNLHLPVITDVESNTEAPRYLVDAYCGSGLFTVTCGEGFQKVIGVDVSDDGVKHAIKNAQANNISNASFVVGNAEEIFKDIKFPGAQTSIIIDPPRKGSDKAFLNQLLDFAPKRIIYISCNVHTQARDIGYLLQHEKGVGYKIDSVRGFDFFPQTHHVESCAVLTRVI